MARQACRLPVLRKDFIIDAYQVLESRLMGADAILLIAAALDKNKLLELEQVASENGLDVLIEIHNEIELEKALGLKTPLIGINNRNLQTFETSLETTINLIPLIPSDKFIISESGIKAPTDIQRLIAASVSGFLIGESLMREANPGKALFDLISSDYL